jgi:hypothetical protein
MPVLSILADLSVLSSTCEAAQGRVRLFAPSHAADFWHCETENLGTRAPQPRVVIWTPMDQEGCPVAAFARRAESWPTEAGG